MKPVFIASAKRTPMGSFGGVLSGLQATQLGSIAIRAAVEAAGVQAEDIQEVFMGNVIAANLGQAPVTQALIGAGLPNTTPGTTINKVCASGMKAVMLGAQSIALGLNDLVVSGGMESMSNIPYYIPGARWGYKFGGGELVDGLQRDGLSDAYDKNAMGVSADATAEKYNISRERQDAFTVQSYTRAAEHTANGQLAKEIVPVSIAQKKGDPIVVVEDEEFRKVSYEKIPGLRPVFTPTGTVTAANASTINDGASALVLSSEEALEQKGIKAMARIVSYADAALEPKWFTVAPAKAAELALQRAGLGIEEIDYFEVNEAFAVVALAFIDHFKLSQDRVNIFGGAVSLGHPLGSSGSRILTTLLHVLEARNARYGMAAICNGGGGASAIIIERV